MQLVPYCGVGHTGAEGHLWSSADCRLRPHANILSNLDGMRSVLGLTSCDSLTGILPFFHSLGSVVTLWFPLLERIPVIYHANPLQGYLHQPEKTAEVITGGWYNTGDIAKIDKEGFIFLTDRLTRFSKIGGEMIPHGALEELRQARQATPEPCIAVVSAPDETKGERLIVCYTERAGEPALLRKLLAEHGVYPRGALIRKKKGEQQMKTAPTKKQTPAPTIFQEKTPAKPAPTDGTNGWYFRMPHKTSAMIMTLRPAIRSR